MSLKLIAAELNIKSSSLYNHISSLDDIKERLMIYGWKQINNNAFGNPISIKESFDVSLEIIMNGIKSLEVVE